MLASGWFISWWLFGDSGLFVCVRCESICHGGCIVLGATIVGCVFVCIAFSVFFSLIFATIFACGCCFGQLCILASCLRMRVFFVFVQLASGYVRFLRVVYYGFGLFVGEDGTLGLCLAGF